MSTYSFTNVLAALTGPGAVATMGYPSGNAEEGISTAMDSDKTTTTTGADGSIMHSLHAGNTGTITVRLLKTSPINAVLDAAYNFQRNNAANWGQNLIVVTDIQRGDIVTGTLMAFVKRPDLTWAMDGNTVEWVFRGVVTETLGVGIPDVSV